MNKHKNLCSSVKDQTVRARQTGESISKATSLVRGYG